MFAQEAKTTTLLFLSFRELTLEPYMTSSYNSTFYRLHV